MTPRSRRPIVAAALMPVLLAAASCGARPRASAGIVLITLDTTRADHLGCYGSHDAATPVLDALAQEGVRFDQALATVPNTLPSHSTMFTGLNPPVHGVRYNGMFRLGDESVTIAELLKAAGRTTGAICSAFPVNAGSGLAQGFESYKDMFSEPGAEKLKPTAERAAGDVTKLGLELIRGAGTKPFFVWLHYYDAHYPYNPPFPQSSRFREHPYDGEIAYIDSQLGELFAGLKKDGLWDRVTVVVAGDHGEGLYEHGERMHSDLVYESTLRVPLLIKTPGARAGSVVEEPVTLADVAPTILDLAGLPIPAGLNGISLRDALGGKAPPTRALYFESLVGSLNFGWSPIEGVRRGKWKLIRAGEPELYDLAADPGEKNDVHALESVTAADLAAVLDADLARWAKIAAPAKQTEAPVDPQALARLASLGYIGGAISTERRHGPNPKTLIHLESELLLLQDYMIEGLYKKALVSTGNILRDDPGNRLALNDAAQASAMLQEFGDAERYAREAMTRYPEYLPAVVLLGRIRVAQKDYKGSAEVFRQGLKAFPDEPILVYSLALSLIAGGRAAEAEPIVDKALQAKDADPGFSVLRAVCRMTAGDAPAGKQALEAAMAAGYRSVYALQNDPLFAPLRKIEGFNEIVTLKKGS